MTILFACRHNAGRSQMAAAICRRLASPGVRVQSAGTAPGDHVHPVVVQVMREWGVDLAGETPRRLTADRALDAEVIVTMGCGESCPVVPGARYEDWPLMDPKDRPIEEVRALREEIVERVRALLADVGGLAGAAPAP